MSKHLLILLAGPLAAVAAVIAFSVAAFGATATPAPDVGPSASPSDPAHGSTPAPNSGSSPAPAAPGQSGQHHCPNM